jgi:hypothetical protein
LFNAYELNNNYYGFIQTKSNFNNASLEVTFIPLTNNLNYYLLKGSEIPINCNLEKGKLYYLKAIFKGNSYSYYIFDNNFNQICSNSGSFTNTDSKVGLKIESNKIYNPLDDELYGIEIFSFKVYNKDTNNELKLNSNIVKEDNGFYFNVPNVNNYAVYIINISDDLKGFYRLINASGFCYLDKYLRCSHDFTNLIAVLVNPNVNKVYFQRIYPNIYYLYDFIQPSYELIPNNKQIQISAENAILGLPYFNLMWKDKDYYYYFGTKYPITTRKGLIKWKLLKGLHIYTNLIKYSIVDYPFNSFFVSNIYYYLSNENIEIIK